MLPVLTSAVLSATLSMVTPSVVRGQQVVPVAPSPVDSIAAKLVELELQRVSPSAQSEVPRDVDSRISALHERLRSLPDGLAAEREVTNRVVLALDARASSVRARIQQMRLAYTDQHPIVRQALTEVRAIDERLGEIRKTR
ncbi:MAG: hypothetical protein ACREBE_00670 [bacterium]